MEQKASQPNGRLCKHTVEEREREGQDSAHKRTDSLTQAMAKRDMIILNKALLAAEHIRVRYAKYT